MSENSEKSGKKVLVFGSGSVSRPCVQYLLGKGHTVAVVDIAEENVKRTLAGHPHGIPVVGDGVGNAAALIREHKPDVVVCLLPTVYLVATAKTCIAEGVSMVGASYAKEEMRALDGSARAKGIKVLCEVGLDPGIDHMSAVAMIRQIQAQGGEIESFVSVCGALPDLSANNNPIGYKLSWAPASLIGASLRDAKIKVDGETIQMPGGTTYQRPGFADIKALGWFETYCNADSLPYLEAYGIQSAKTIQRGTLRYTGWCDMVTQMQKLHLFDEDKRSFEGLSYADMMFQLAGGKGKPASVAAAREAAATFMGIEPYTTTMQKLDWLGLFSDRPVEPQQGCLRDVVSRRYAERLVFSPGEYDLCAMQHEYIVKYAATGKRKKFTSTMIARGPVDGDTAIASTTGIPIGIAAHLVLSGVVQNDGVLIPTTEDIYVPALAELERVGIRFAEYEEDL